MNRLPHEVVLHVAEYLLERPRQGSPLIVLSLVNRKWKSIVRDRQLWTSLLNEYQLAPISLDHPFDCYLQSLQRHIYVVTTKLGPFSGSVYRSTKCFTSLALALDQLAVTLLLSVGDIPNFYLVSGFLYSHQQYTLAQISELIIDCPSLKELRSHPVGSRLFEDFRKYTQDNLCRSDCEDWACRSRKMSLKIVKCRVLSGVV